MRKETTGAFDGVLTICYPLCYSTWNILQLMRYPLNTDKVLCIATWVSKSMATIL